jgi:hypothetical protein
MKTTLERSIWRCMPSLQPALRGTILERRRFRIRRKNRTAKWLAESALRTSHRSVYANNTRVLLAEKRDIWPERRAGAAPFKAEPSN